MSESARQRALKNYRDRLTRRGMSRFEVIGLEADRGLIRSLARRLAENDREAAQLRSTVARGVCGDPPKKKGGLLAALRRSPLVGAEIDLTRSITAGRKVDL